MKFFFTSIGILPNYIYLNSFKFISLSHFSPAIDIVYHNCNRKVPIPVDQGITQLSNMSIQLNIK